MRRGHRGQEAGKRRDDCRGATDRGRNARVAAVWSSTAGALGGPQQGREPAWAVFGRNVLEMTMTLIHLFNRFAQMCRDLCGALGRGQRLSQASLLLEGWAKPAQWPASPKAGL